MNTKINFRRRAPLWAIGISMIQEKIRNPRIREKISRAFSKFLPMSNIKTNLGADLYNKLESLGYCEMPDIINDKQVEDLKTTVLKMDCIDPWRRNLGKFKIENAPTDTHTAHVQDILSIPGLIEIANNPLALEICERYFGSKPIIDSIQIWWSLPGHESPEQAENFHRDNDGLRFLKYFIYLTEVKEDSGPHVYIERSHTQAKGLSIRRYNDEEIEELFGKESFKKFTGKKGLSFIEDTYGFHKGQLSQTNKRLLLQIRYAITPTIFLNKNYLEDNNQYSHLDKYINRYLFRK